jgi:serine/threonine-protein kinase HipA
LMDRVFRRAGISPTQITGMDRLAFIGNSGLGALSYEPSSEYRIDTDANIYSIDELGLQAQALFDGQTTEVLAALVAAGSSGGARPKAQLYLAKNNHHDCSTQYSKGKIGYIVKFTSSQLALGHEEGLCEAAYLTLAKKAGIDVPNWSLLEAPKKSGASYWLALERFDTYALDNGHEGRFHLHSACGLLDADFRLPSLDYEDLIKASSQLCKSPSSGQMQFRRAVFNLFAANQDDHSKNWAFLQNDHGQWQIAPFYDVTFSPSPYGEHATAYCGHGKKPPVKAMQRLANHANFASWKLAQEVIEEVVTSLNEFTQTASNLGVSKETIKLIGGHLERVFKDNKALLS